MMREKFNQSKQLTFLKKINTVPRATKLYNKKSTFVSAILPFPSRET